MTRWSRTAWSVWVLLLIVAMGGCGDDATKPPRGPMVWNVPDEFTFEQAAEGAISGDTLEVSSVFAPLPPLSTTVTIDGDQTPLVIRSERGYPVLTVAGDVPILRFVSPRSGTRITGMGFAGGSNSLVVEGGGAITVEQCTFVDGTVQVLGSGNGVRVEVTGTVMRNAAAFSILMQSRAQVTATNNTIDGSGDCGILLESSSLGQVENCIVSHSANYGIACTTGGSLAAASGCNDIYMSGTAMYLGCGPGVDDFDLDPQFCGPPDDLTIQTTSPCAPANSGDCGLIGAFIDLCEPIPPGPGASNR